jgi:hypothetical protein
MASSAPYYNSNNHTQQPYPTIVQGHPTASNLDYASPYSQYADPPLPLPLQPHYHASGGNGNNNNSSSSHHTNNSAARPAGQHGFRDVVWGLLFYAHLVGVAYLTVVFAPQAMEAATASSSSSSSSSGGNYRHQRRLYDNGGQDDDDGAAADSSSSSSSSSSGATALNIDPTALLAVTAIAGVLGCVFSSLALGKPGYLPFVARLESQAHTTGWVVPSTAIISDFPALTLQKQLFIAQDS